MRLGSIKTRILGALITGTAVAFIACGGGSGSAAGVSPVTQQKVTAQNAETIDLGNPDIDNYSSMAILKVDTGDPAIVYTTGARYQFNASSIDMVRCINPETNAKQDRLVSRIELESSGGYWFVKQISKDKVALENDLLTVVVHGDSLLFVTPKVGALKYSHINLVENVAWGKSDRSYVDRMWSDGKGGSLHGAYVGTPIALSHGANNTLIQCKAGDTMVHMVFPSRHFNFDKLYAQSARPFVLPIGNLREMDEIISNSEYYKKKHFGVILLWNDFYRKSVNKNLVPEVNPGEQYFPSILQPSESAFIGNKAIAGYDFVDPEGVTERIQKAHSAGFKVITYFSAPAFNPEKVPGGYEYINKQPVDVTLNYMRQFLKKYGTDGFYFDNAAIQPGQLNQNYDFIRAVRGMIGSDGIIVHHNSVDAWDKWLAYTGLRGVMIDNYVDYTVSGETGVFAELNDPNDPYLQHYASGYGYSQAIGSCLQITSGKAAISREDCLRAMAANYNGHDWYDWPDFNNYFLPFYEERKKSYTTSGFVPMPGTPSSGLKPWYYNLDNVGTIINADGTSTVFWSTPEVANSYAVATSPFWGDIWYETYANKGNKVPVPTWSQAKVVNHSLKVKTAPDVESMRIAVRSATVDSDGIRVYGFVGKIKK